MRLGCEDWDFNIRLGLAGAEGLCLAEPLFHYRLSTNETMRSTSYRNYGAIWRGMQKKYPDVYRIFELLRRAQARAKERRRHASWFLLAVYGMHRLLPHMLFSLLLRVAFSLRFRMRTSRIIGKRVLVRP